MTAMDKNKEVYRTIGGVLFGISLLIFAWLMVKGFAILTIFLSEITEHVIWAKILIILLVFFLIVITAVAKANVGGDALGILNRELYKWKKKKQKKAK
jgi:hypothetical protein